jgi:hypothetical protein
MLRNWILILLACASFVQCQNDENALHEYDLFGRLQAGEGIWKIDSYTDYDNSIANPTKTTTYPTDHYFEFYVRTKEITAVLIDVASVNIYKGDTVSVFDCEAEKERVVFRLNEVFGGTVWTVLENERTFQVWSYTEGNTTREMTLSKCDCVLPKNPSQEIGG